MAVMREGPRDAAGMRLDLQVRRSETFREIHLFAHLDGIVASTA